MLQEREKGTERLTINYTLQPLIETKRKSKRTVHLDAHVKIYPSCLPKIHMLHTDSPTPPTIIQCPSMLMMVTGAYRLHALPPSIVKSKIPLPIPQVNQTG